MKNRTISLFVLAVFAVSSCFVSGCGSKKTETPKKAAGPVKAGAIPVKAEIKKVFKGGMGGFTVKLAGANGSEKRQRVRAFRTAGPKLSSYVGSFTTNRMQELLPGVYDIEIDTMPQIIYKQISVSKDKETVEDIGCVTGTVVVKALSQTKKPVNFPVRVFYPGSKILVAAGVMNKPFEVLAGTYDIELATLPVQHKKAFKVEKGKENAVDLGVATGILLIKALDENGAPANRPVRIKKAGAAEFVAAAFTNRPIELLAGAYDIDILSKPVQVQKNIEVKTGAETTIDIMVAIPAVPAPKAAAPAAPTALKKAE